MSAPGRRSLFLLVQRERDEKALWIDLERQAFAVRPAQAGYGEHLARNRIHQVVFPFDAAGDTRPCAAQGLQIVRIHVGIVVLSSQLAERTSVLGGLLQKHGAR